MNLLLKKMNKDRRKWMHFLQELSLIKIKQKIEGNSCKLNKFLPIKKLSQV